MKNFLDINQIEQRQLRSILDDASRIKAARAGLPKGTKDVELPFAGQMVALIFEKPSTRTRVSFDVGVRQMGGQKLMLDRKSTRLNSSHANESRMPSSA